MINTKESQSRLLTWLEDRKYPYKFDLAKAALSNIEQSRFVNGNWVKVKSVEKLNESNFVGWNSLPSREIILQNGTRTHNTGKTTVTAIKALYYAWKIPNKPVIIISPSMRQSQELFKRLANFAENSQIRSLIANITGTEIRFKNGSVVKPFPAGKTSTGSTIRGASPSVVIFEEGDFMAPDIIMSMLPSLAGSKNTRLIHISSPGTSPDVFGYKLINLKNDPIDALAHMADKISIHRASTFDNANYNKLMVDQFRSTHTLAEYNREILGMYEFGDSKLIDYNSVISISKLEPTLMPTEGMRYVAGIDVALGGGDKTCISMFRVDDKGGLFKHMDMQFYKLLDHTDSTTLVSALTNILDLWKPEAIYVDSTGLGRSVADPLQSKYNNVTPFTFTSKSTTELYSNLKMVLEHSFNEMEESDTVTLIKDKTIAEHITSPSIEYTNDGNMKVVKQSGKGKDDILDSVALALLHLNSRDQFVVTTSISRDKTNLLKALGTINPSFLGNVRMLSPDKLQGRMKR